MHRQLFALSALFSSPLDFLHIWGEVLSMEDKADQTRTEYPTYRMCKRWWIYVFYFLLDLSVVNAFILMKE
jgi:hypothetical protein